MSNEIIPLFSTPVYKTSVEVPDVDAVLKTLPYEPYPDNSGYSSKDVKILESEPFKDIRAIIEKHMHMYCFEFLRLANCKIVHSQSWINLHKPGNFSPKHFHSNSCYSGGLYLDVPQGSGGLVFNGSHTSPTYCTGTVKPLTTDGNIFNADRWGFDVKKGDLFLFPSHLMHETDPNATSQNRYMVAFNYFLEGKIGDNTRQLHIKLQ